MTHKPVTRRVAMKCIGLAATTLALGTPAIVRAQGKGSITFFSYATYSDVQLTGEFSKQTGIEYKAQNFGDLDQMVAKLKAADGQGLDVVSVPNQLTNQLYKDGLLEPIDISRLKYWNALYPEFRDANFVKGDKPGQALAVPTVWGPEGIIYRTDKIKEVDSWAALWDERYKGRIAGNDYAYEMVLIAAQVLGYTEQLKKDPIDFTPEQYAAIKSKLLEQKKLIAKNWGSSAEGATLIASGEVWITIGRLAMLKPIQEEKVPVRMLAPKEGAQGWCTNTAILKASKNKDAAYEFLNFVTGEHYQNKLMTVRGYPVANKQIMDMQTPEFRNQLTMNDPALLKSLVWWQNAKDIQKINTLWNEVKAG